MYHTHTPSKQWKIEMYVRWHLHLHIFCVISSLDLMSSLSCSIVWPVILAGKFSLLSLSVALHVIAVDCCCHPLEHIRLDLYCKIAVTNTDTIRLLLYAVHCKYRNKKPLQFETFVFETERYTTFRMRN